MDAGDAIAQRLREHLTGDGTANDSTTDQLYREAHSIAPDIETDIEEVESWAHWVISPTIDAAARATRTP